MSSSPENFRTWRPPAAGPADQPSVRPLLRPRRREVGAWTAPSLDGPATPVYPDETAEESAAARESGWQAGLEEGIRRGAAERQSLAQAVAQATRSMSELCERLEADRAADVTALALAIARHLVMRELVADPSILEGLVSRGLEQIKPDGPINVRLNPEDYAQLESGFDCLTTLETGPVRWLSDETVGRGGFVMETPRRLVEGRVEDALRRIYERLVYE